MTTMTAHSVKARNLRQSDLINILFQPFTITNLTITESAVFVCAESSDEIGSMLSETVYPLDEYVTVFMPTEA